MVMFLPKAKKDSVAFVRGMLDTFLTHVALVMSGLLLLGHWKV